MLEEAPAPVGNPLKGLIPYANPPKNRFPHSMKFFHIPLCDVVKDRGEYDWSALDRRLDGIAARGNQAVFRFYPEYPGKTDGIPPHLTEDGLKVHRHMNTNTAPLPPSEVMTPDYADPLLRGELKAFIAALGKRHDGDPRIGFITAGLLGTWGEWHTHPRPELFASRTVQREVMDAYAQAFRVTPILLRYPAGEDHGSLAANTGSPFGYHDDSFAWAPSTPAALVTPGFSSPRSKPRARRQWPSGKPGRAAARSVPRHGAACSTTSRRHRSRTSATAWRKPMSPG